MSGSYFKIKFQGHILGLNQISGSYYFWTHIHPLPYKRTGDISISPVHQKIFCRPSSFLGKNLSPVQFFPYIFSYIPVLKNTKFSPVLSCSKIGHPSCFSPVLLYGRGCMSDSGSDFSVRFQGQILGSHIRVRFPHPILGSNFRLGRSQSNSKVISPGSIKKYALLAYLVMRERPPSLPRLSIFRFCILSLMPKHF